MLFSGIAFLKLFWPQRAGVDNELYWNWQWHFVLSFFFKGSFSDVMCHWTCSSCDAIEICSFCLEFLGVNCVFVKEFSYSCSQYPAFSQNWVCSLSWWHFPSRTASVVLSLLKGPWAIFRGNFTLQLIYFGYWCFKIAVFNCSWFSPLK